MPNVKNSELLEMVFFNIFQFKILLNNKILISCQKLTCMFLFHGLIILFLVHFCLNL